MRENKGFTLIELLISIALMISLGSFAIVNLVNYLNRRTLEDSAFELLGYVRDAQQRAISQENSSNWGIYADASVAGSHYYHEFYGASHAAGTDVNVVYLSLKVKFIEVDPSKELIFSKLTGIPNSAMTLKISLLSDETICKTIDINAQGLISAATCP